MRKAALQAIVLCAAPAAALAQAEALPSIDLGAPVAGASPADCLDGAACESSAHGFSLDDLLNLGVVENAPPSEGGPRARLGVVDNAPSLSEAERAAPLPSIDVEILFAYDSDAPLPEADPVLRDLARAVADPRFDGRSFVVMGHTDAVGGDAYNQALSERRAAAVRERLVSLSGVARDRFRIDGQGERFLKDPTSPASPANRRVQLIVLPY